MKFATYTRDSATGLDYADQRHYANTFGRFMSPDPYKATSTGAADPSTPASWNRYAYVVGDPVNYYDRRGLFQSKGSVANVTDPCFDVEEGDDACGGGSDGEGGGGNGGSPGGGGTRPPKVKLPELNSYTPARVAALQAAFDNALNRLNDPICEKALTPAVGSDFTGFASAILTNTNYRILDLGGPTVNPATGGVSVVGAQTVDSANVVINSSGPVFGQFLTLGLIDIFFDQGTGLTGGDFGALLLLHELGHQTGVFGPDVNSPVNAQYTQTVLDNCFKKGADGKYH